MHRCLALLESFICLALIFVLLLGTLDVFRMQEVWNAIWNPYFKIIRVVVFLIFICHFLLNLFFPPRKVWEVLEPASKEDVEAWMARLELGSFHLRYNHSKSAAWVLRKGRGWLVWEWFLAFSLCAFLFWATPTLYEGFLGILRVSPHSNTQYLEVLRGTTEWGEAWQPVRGLEGDEKIFRKIPYTFEGQWNNLVYESQSLLPVRSELRWRVHAGNQVLLEKSLKNPQNFLFSPEPEFRFRYLGPALSAAPQAQFVVKKRSSGVASGSFSMSLRQNVQLPEGHYTLLKIERGLDQLGDAALVRWVADQDGSQGRDLWFFTGAPQLDTTRRKQTSQYFELTKIEAPLEGVFSVTSRQVPIWIFVVFGLCFVSLFGTLVSRRAVLEVQWRPDHIKVEMKSAHLSRWGDWLERLNAELGK